MAPALLVLFAAFFRLIPHAPNFTPIGAMALYAGATVKDWRLALLVTFGAMLLSDLVIGFDATSPAVYLALALSVFIGRSFRSAEGLQSRVQAGILSATLSAIIFFAITNFAVWVTGELYPLTLEGLKTCYIAAIPFFRNTLLSDYLYFGALCLANRFIANRLFIRESSARTTGVAL